MWSCQDCEGASFEFPIPGIKKRKKREIAISFLPFLLFYYGFSNPLDEPL